MKTLELNQMEKVEGGDWLLGFSCAGAIFLGLAAGAATAGAGLMLAGYAAATVCGISLGKAF